MYFHSMVIRKHVGGEKGLFIKIDRKTLNEWNVQKKKENDMTYSYYPYFQNGSSEIK